MNAGVWGNLRCGFSSAAAAIKRCQPGQERHTDDSED